jgi:soluble lytic murein transglycosylase-like protein
MFGMNRSQLKIAQGLGKLWSYVDRGHLALFAIALGTFLYYSHTLDQFQEQVAKANINFEENLKWSEAKVYVLEEEFLYGESNMKDLGPYETEVYVAYLERREALVRIQVIPILAAQIEVLMPKGKKARKAWEEAGLPTPIEMANIYYDASREFNHDPTILISIGWAESRFRADICSGKKASPAGALGCMQIMPQWVKKLDFVDTKKQLASDFQTNVFASAAIFREYLDHRYGKGRNIPALYMYNYGPKSYGYRVRNKKKFNGYAVSVMKKVKSLKQIVPVEITVKKTVTVDSLNPL